MGQDIFTLEFLEETLAVIITLLSTEAGSTTCRPVVVALHTEGQDMRGHASKERGIQLREECRMTASDLMIIQHAAIGR